ncbi:antitoxin CptB [Ectothiorhodospira magna]|uniref:FAD assembly factor SdhE n=1 Tax=Ectothiorhodospira magna TaxID=867345 RepID=A0A1H8ZTX1_9GAMM|nr:succinate dehydrogenase assembly factor 2 [Ectothiorhodospira magna]SEP67208.1 antitoxin CptB [Ectothiorhodospira magna]
MMSDIARLRWHCRRGTKELDLMLEGFLLAQGEHLDATELQTFEQILKQEDDHLQRWLLYGEPVEKTELATMIHRVRRHFIEG